MEYRIWNTEYGTSKVLFRSKGYFLIERQEPPTSAFRLPYSVFHFWGERSMLSIVLYSFSSKRMSTYEQRTIEHFFQDHKIDDPDTKARLLPKLTHIIYGYNQSIVALEKETDEYRRTQIEREIREIKDKIDRVITDEMSGKKTEFDP
jgi:hypothetical protein